MSELFGIFGNPIAHSKSPLMHNYTFRALKYKGCYTRYLLQDGKKLKEYFLALGLSGANITVPHKEVAFTLCDELDDFAKKVGAVNTIIKKDDKLIGYNTDAPGFLKCVKEFVGTQTILILGAGGTVKSTSILLKECGYKVAILARNKERLKEFEENFECYNFDNFIVSRYDLVINMTSAGLLDDSLPAPRNILEPTLIKAKGVIDIIYGKETPFLQLAKTLGKDASDGEDMLINQGILAFDLFTNHKFTLDTIEKYMKQAFIL